MENFYSWIRNFKLPTKQEIKKILASFSKKEWLVFFIFNLVLLISFIGILQNINQSLMVKIPMKGGSISEGIIGTPRFINPILAISDADRDLVALIYSGLMRKNSDGSFIPDLAEKYEISKDGLTYTFTLKDNIYFHNGNKISTDDVLFTVNAVKDPVIKSPKKSNWDGVNAEKIDAKTIKFTLKQPYASFLENTTLGIMPIDIWHDSLIELNNANTNPVGSGPYLVNKVNKQTGGIINYYDLTAYKKFILGKPYIKNITLHFYPNENDLVQALENKEVDAISSITPANAELLKEKNYRIKSAVLPRIFGLFFNQNQNQIFTNKTVLKAINEIIDKKRIVQQLLLNYGIVIDGPIPPFMNQNQKISAIDTISRREKIKNIEDTLTKDGWKKNADGLLEKNILEKKSTKNKNTVSKKDNKMILTFSISTGNTKELAETAQIIKENLAEIGIKVDIKTFDIGNLNQSVIRPRKYDALLFGEIINQASELFAFWHSSQRKDPGLNVSLYTNTKVDKILEDAFITNDKNILTKKYLEFEEEIRKDTPAIFLYSPDYIYVVSQNLKGLSMGHVVSPSDRFSNVYTWYTETDNVWKIFAN